MKIEDGKLDYWAERYRVMRTASQLPLRTKDGKAYTFERFLAQIAASRKGGLAA